MSNDKMRAEFEAWRLRNFCGGAERLKKCSNAPEIYYYTAEQEAWKVWQASSADLVVELPPAPVPQKRYGGTYTRTESAYHQGQMSVIRSIEAAGVRVKP